MPDPTPGERSLGQLVTDATAQASTLVRYEIALAKAELTAQAKSVGAASGFVIGAVFVGHLALITLVITIGAGLMAAGLPAWGAFAVLSTVLLLIAGVLVWIGLLAARKAKGGRTARTLSSLASLRSQPTSLPPQPNSLDASTAPSQES